MAPSKSSPSPDEAASSFPFIVSNGPGKVKDPALRTLIRKQAMKDVGLARKRKGNYGRANARQPIVFEEAGPPIEGTVHEVSNPTSTSSASSNSSPETSTASTEPTEYDVSNPSDWAVVSQSDLAPPDVSFMLPPLISFDSGYERAKVRFSVDLTQLTLMTNFNMSKFAIRALSAEPTRLIRLMEDRQWSYLEYVPSMYDSSKCLAAATDCLLAKVSQVLAPSPADTSVMLRLYSKALTALQEAITEPSSSTAAETLGAIQLMALHEILDPDRTAAWTSHTKGAERLVKHRTTSRFKTEFEKALFAAHVGPIVSEALMGNMHCYLAEPEWVELYSSIVEETTFLTERSELVANARILMFKLPGLWTDVTAALKGDDLFNEDVLQDLISRCRSSHADYIDWLEQYKSHCLRTSFTQPPQSEINLRRDIFGASTECLLITKRLLACVCDEDRIALEIEAQALATFLLELQKQPSPKHSWLFTPHEVGVALSVQASRETFEEENSHEDWETRKLAMRRRYYMWDGLLRVADS